MKLPEAIEIYKLVGVVVYGFLCRSAFSWKVPHRKEEFSQSILLAAILSIPLQFLFYALSFHPWIPPWLHQHSNSMTSGPSQMKEFPFEYLYNCLWSIVIGFIIGVIVANYVRKKRCELSSRPQREEITNSPFHKGLLALVKDWARCGPANIDVSQDWMQEIVNGKWIVVELNDQRAFMGWVSRWDQSDDRCANMHFVLQEPYVVNTNTGVRLHSVGDAILLSLTDVKLIRLICVAE